MTRTLDDGLNALSHVDYDATLDGLESAVWGAVERRKREAMTPGVQFGVAAAAIAVGLAFGLGANVVRPHGYAFETQVLSDNTVAPSILIGG